MMNPLQAFSRSSNFQSIELSEDNTAKVDFSKNLALLEAFMKISESIKAELVPANDIYLDKKGFTWELSSFDEGGLSFSFNFDHPKYISVGGTDTMKMTFNNSNAFMSP